MKLLPPLSMAWRFDSPRVLAAQMGLLDRNLSMAFLTSCVVSWLTAAAFVVVEDDLRAVWWAFLTTGVGGACLIARGALPPPDDSRHVLRYAQAVRLMAALVGCCWGALAPTLIQADHPESVTLVLGVTAGMNSGGLAVFAPSWPVAMAYWVCSAVPVAVVLIKLGGAVNVALGLAVLTYLWAMTVFSYHTAQMALRSIELRFENEGLIRRLRDQTERAFEARQMAEEALREAEQANRAKTVFLASASHDLRQPLHAMGLFLGTLARTVLDAPQQKLLAHAQASAGAAGEMLHTLLDFSRVDAGVVKPAAVSFSLQSVFDKLDREFAPLAAAQGLAWRVRPTPLVLHADPALVELILRNLLLNALRYTERGTVLLACRRRGRKAVVEVWDTGIGIDAAHHQTIFKAFHQLGNPERDRHKGLGLGLSIVEGLARTMSVDVGLRSVPGRGSVFRLSLLLSPQTALDHEPPAAEEAADLVGLRVLLIDDDEGVRQAMSELLSNWGCWCEVADGADSALSLLEGFTPDLLLVDYRLRQHRTGLQAIEVVRAALGEAVPAVIVTGDTAAEPLREAHDSGLTLLHKPVSAERLRRVVQACGLQLAAPTGAKEETPARVAPQDAANPLSVRRLPLVGGSSAPAAS